MKSTEELDALKQEVETLSKKIEKLSKEEFAQVSGGMDMFFRCPVRNVWLLRKNTFSDSDKKTYLCTKYETCCRNQGKTPDCINCDFLSSWQQLVL